LLPGIPLAEVVANGKYSFLGAGLFLITPGTTDAGIEFQFFDRVEQGYCLQNISAGIFTRLFFHLSLVDRILHITNNELHTRVFSKPVAKADGLGKVVACIYMQHGKWHPCREKSFAGQVHQRNGILAT
jgi:hypothetical protein